ncbi:hypothetical protein X551_03192 [Methylibium sp. T29]|nr:hypothetical protein X551_03192 [Methylibium sp. T29]
MPTLWIAEFSCHVAGTAQHREEVLMELEPDVVNEVDGRLADVLAQPIPHVPMLRSKCAMY